MLIFNTNEFVSLYLVTELLLEKIRQNKGLTSVDMEELEILIAANDSLRAVMVRSIENKKNQKMHNCIEFKTREHLLIVSEQLRYFDLNKIPDSCFRLLFADQLLKICKKLNTAYYSWSFKPKKVRFNNSEMLVIKKVVSLSHSEIMDNPISMCLLIPTTP